MTRQSIITDETQLLATSGLANSRMTTKLFVHLLYNIFPWGTVTFSKAATGQTQNVAAKPQNPPTGTVDS
jgi:hypothetical protein